MQHLQPIERYPFSSKMDPTKMKTIKRSCIKWRGQEKMKNSHNQKKDVQEELAFDDA